MKAIFFDFDGTLADTAPGIICTMQETFKAMQLPLPTEEEIRQTIGMPLVQAIKVLGHFDDEGAERGTAFYRKLYYEFEINNIGIFPGVEETIKVLAGLGIRMAICTSRNRDSLETILGRYGLLSYFETSVTNSDHLAPKPAPDMVNVLLSRMNLTKEEALVVGDTTFDIEMGNRAGCRTIAVKYGNHTPEQLQQAHPTWIIDQFPELKDLVEKM